METIGEIYTDTDNNNKISDLSLTTNDILSLKYAPITSCDVERSFLKNLLSDKRLCLKNENIEKYMIVQCNQ